MVVAIPTKIGNFAELQTDQSTIKTCCYLIWQNPYMTIGSDTFIHSMIEKAGLINCCAGKKRYPTISIEEIQELNASLGLEYWYNNQFAFRAGYFYENPTKGNRKFLSVGAGLKYNVFGLNFAYIFPSGNGSTRNPLSNTYRFGLVFDFDGSK